MSLLFYAWGEPLYVLVMLGSICFNYFLGLRVQGPNKKLYLVLATVVNLSVLVFFKYWGFIVDNINLLFEKPLLSIGEVYLPIGISFFTFQALSYVIDVYRNETPPQSSIVNLALYISLFPQLIAGPIVRYHDINNQLQVRSTSWAKFASGTERFLIGLIKKVIIANNLAYIADTVFDQQFTIDTPTAWVGIIAYTFQIYFDFSGYSDMAIGIGRMLGFDILENFNYPYISKSIREFWRRWHISLSTWFRDYLYIPLGGNRGTKVRTYINLFIVFLLTGLWHGASWNFVIWGLFHGIFLIFERVSQRFSLKIPNALSHSYVILVVVVGWVFFRAQDLSSALSYLYNMFVINLSADYPNNIRYLVSKEIMIVALLAVTFSMPVKRWLLAQVKQKSERVYTIGLGLYRLTLLVFFLISLSYLAAESYNPFIYFRF